MSINTNWNKNVSNVSIPEQQPASALLISPPASYTNADFTLRLRMKIKTNKLWVVLGVCSLKFVINATICSRKH